MQYFTVYLPVFALLYYSLLIQYVNSFLINLKLMQIVAGRLETPARLILYID